MSTFLEPQRCADDVTALKVMTEEMRPLLIGDGYQMFEVRAPESSGPPPHQHPWDESYVVLEGELWVSRGGEETTLQVGEAIRVPAGVVHAYRVLSDGARWITTSSTPGGALDFFSDVDAASNGPGDVRASSRPRSETGSNSPIRHCNSRHFDFSARTRRRGMPKVLTAGAEGGVGPAAVMRRVGVIGLGGMGSAWRRRFSRRTIRWFVSTFGPTCYAHLWS